MDDVAGSVAIQFAPTASAVAVAISAIVLFLALLPIVIADDITGNKFAKADSDAKKLKNLRILAILLTLYTGSLVLSNAMALGANRLTARVARESPLSLTAMVPGGTQQIVDDLTGNLSGLLTRLTVVTIISISIGWTVWTVDKAKTSKEAWHTTDRNLLIGGTVVSVLALGGLAAALFQARTVTALASQGAGFFSMFGK